MNRIIQIGTPLELDWFIDDCFTRPLASIEASARVKDPSMKLYYMKSIGIPLVVHWHSIGCQLTFHCTIET